MSTAMPVFQPQPSSPFSSFAANTRPSRKRHAPIDESDIQREQPLSKRLSRLSINNRAQDTFPTSSFRVPNPIPQPLLQQQQSYYIQPQQSYYTQPNVYPTYPPQPTTPTIHPVIPPTTETDMEMDLSDLSSHSDSSDSETSSPTDSSSTFMFPKHIKKTLNRLPYHLLRSQSSSSSPSVEPFPVTGQELVLYRPVNPARDEREEMKKRFLEARERERREKALVVPDTAGDRIVEIDDEGNEVGGVEWDPDAMEIE